MLLSFIMIKFLVILVLRFVRILIINMLFWIWLKLVFEMMYMYYNILCDWFVNKNNVIFLNILFFYVLKVMN